MNEAGPSPFNKSAYADWLKTKISRKNKSQFKQWLAPFTPASYKAIRNSLTGDDYKMPQQDYNELVDWLKEHHSELSDTYKSNGKQLKRNIQTPADFIDFAFEKEAQKKNLESIECKGGHITAVTYNVNYKLLMVQFRNVGRNGNVVVFFNLPAEVAATLMIHGKYNNMAPPRKDGKERHMIGVEFWNLVRVRGTLHGTRYPFQYSSDYRTGNPSGRTPGIGPDGKPSKYIYSSDAEALDHRYLRQRRDYENDEIGKRPIDSTSDPEAKLRKISAKNPLRTERDYAEYAQQLKQENYAADEGITGSSYSVKELKNYFDNGGFDQDMSEPDVNKEALQEAFDVYDNASTDAELQKAAAQITALLTQADAIVR